MASDTERPEERGLHAFQLFSMAFGVAIGIGWIMVIGLWLGAAGPLGASLAFLISAIVMLTIGLAYARVAIEYPIPGGEFAYVRRSFGLLPGFWVGWFLALGYVVVIGFELVSLAWIARELLPILPDSPPGDRGLDLPGLAIAAIILVAVILFNTRGARAAARLQDVLVVAKVVLSIGLVAAGLTLGDARNLEPLWGAHASGSWLRGMIVVLAMAPFFYAGFGVVAQAIAEVRTPATIRILPRIMVAAILGTMLFYVLIIMATASAAPRGAILNGSLPAAAAFGVAFGTPMGAQAVMILGLLGLLTILNGIYFAAVRLIQALADAGLLPRAMGAPGGGPGISRLTGLFVALCGLGLACLGKTMLAPLLNVTSMAFSAVMASVCAVLIQQRYAAGQRQLSRFLSPLIGCVLAVIMVAITFTEALAASPDALPPELLIIAGWVVAGLFLSLRRRTAQDSP